MIKILFYFFVLLVIYIYIGYPLLLLLISSIKKIITSKSSKDSHYNENELPTLSVFISAYNEEAIIREKLDNIYEVDYPMIKIQVIVASDGSTDLTNEMVGNYDKYSVELLKYEINEGKIETINKSLDQINNDIVIFTDATTMFVENSFKKIVQNFKDSKIGLVGGKLMLKKENENISKLSKNYWEYESFIKEKESVISSVIGVSGAFYAVRSNLLTTTPSYIARDLLLPLKIILDGYKVKFDSESLAYEDTMTDVKNEFKKRSRIVLNALPAVFECMPLLNIFKYKYDSFFLWSHRILRWLSPVFLIMIFITNALLINSFYFSLLFYSQIGFYLIGCLTFIYPALLNRFTIFKLINYFLLRNYAVLKSLILYILGRKQGSWADEYK
jgi:cellulose synthase/poly-beta-1,6-N-acetylglucosamine synthase-like glycosyltransferase